LKNKNPLLFPRLREILTAENVKILQSFCEAEYLAVIEDPIPVHAFEKTLAAPRFSELSCQITSTPPDDFDEPFCRERSESDNPIKWRLGA
jgi:hypothetical protein